MPKIQNMPSERTIATKTENKREDSGEEGNLFNDPSGKHQ
jgi:hypothetical protein